MTKNESERWKGMDLLVADFDNKVIIILSDSQMELFDMEGYNQKKDLLKFLPRKSLYMRGNILAFDFENEIIIAYDDLPFDGRNYNFNELKRMDSEFVIGLAQRKNEILDVLGFEIQVSDDFAEKYREYAEFMDCQGLPR